MADGNQRAPEPFEISQGEEPKRFVRTLESDAAAIKQGAKPDFTEALAAPEPEPPPPPPAPEPEPPPPPPPPAEPTEPASARIVEGSVFPTFSLTKEVEPEVKLPAPPAPAPSEKAPLRTYTSDFAARIKKTDASTASVLAAEGDAGPRAALRPPSSSIPFIVGGILLFVLGVGGAYATYSYLSSPEPIQIAPGISSPIFVNERVEVSGAGEALMGDLVASLKEPLGGGEVRLLYLTSTTSPRDIFHALMLPAPGTLSRNVREDGSIAGIVNAGGVSPFFILKVDSYGDTFAGMLAWEPKAGSDLAALFAPSATSTRPWRDEVIGNHDVRALRDAAGQSVLMYGYSDPSTLVIAKDERAYAELVKRLTTSRTAR